MGMIHIDLFTTLDGVAQAPGGPDEDTDGGFPYGGWQAPLFDDVVGANVGEGMATMDALLLGRKTYDIFAGYWPNAGTEGEDAGIATVLNGLPKYVASRGAPSLEWANSTLLGDDVVTAVRGIRDRHEHVHVIGSIDFAQTLIAERLYDVLALWVFPVALGTGKRVFPDGAAPAGLRLLEPPLTTPKGAVLLRYGPGEPPVTGDMTLPDRGV